MTQTGHWTIQKCSLVVLLVVFLVASITSLVVGILLYSFLPTEGMIMSIQGVVDLGLSYIAYRVVRTTPAWRKR